MLCYTLYLHCLTIMKLISIIIPYYNNIKFIEQTIDSILNQTYQNFEIIIIYDDENQDDLKVIKQLTRNQNQIKLIINKKKIGAGLSRNVGILNAKGDYIAFIDSDDYWDSDKLRVQLNFMLSKNIDFTHTSYQIVDETGKIKGCRKAKNFFHLKELLKSCDIGLSTVIIKKSLLTTNRFPNLKTKEDFVLWLILLKQGNRIYSIAKNLTYWRKTKNSLSSNIYQKIIDGYSVYKDYMKMSIFKSILYLVFLSINSFRK
jgi:teichuronic acid biosynthesis glycosyltransferase TuaG